jgi:hypothetical protein
MPIPLITPLPVPPSRADATNFAIRADAFLGALPTFQTEMNAAASAINSVYFPPIFRNKIINGDFSIWQRGKSQTSSGYGSDDRWANGYFGSTATHSRQTFALGQTEVPGDPVYFSRTVVTSVAGTGNFVQKSQRIEGVRTFAGRSARLSFSAKADAARPIAFELLQNFGTGGSPSAEVLAIGAQKVNLTTVWQRFSVTIALPSIAGKVIGSGGNDFLTLAFWLDAGSSFNSRSSSLGQQSGTFDISQVQIEEGTVETAFEQRPPSIELALCQRYFYAAFEMIRYMTLPGTASNVRNLWQKFPVRMRATPTIANITGLGSPTVSPGKTTLDEVEFYASMGDTVTPAYVVTYTADAEL